MKLFALILLLIILVALGLTGTIMSLVPEPSYTVIQSQGNIEVREYAPMIVAEVEVSGPRKEAINQGFRLLASYIFGENSPNEKIAMTAPVMQEKGEEIAMTAPVMQQGSSDHWKVRFVMPENYTMESLPKPKSDKIEIIPIPSKRVAVV